MNVVALVPVVGRGERLNIDSPQALVPVSGQSLLLRTVRGLLDSGRVQHVVVAAPTDEVGTFAREVASLSAVEVVPCDSDWSGSIHRAFAVAERTFPDVRIVLVHDVARAFTPASLICDVIDAVERGAPAVVPVLPVSDTVKKLDGAGNVAATVDRRHLRSVQTPQGFAVDVLREAYAVAEDALIDEIGLIERVGRKITTVPGHPHALRINTAFDLAIAESVLATAGGPA